VNPLSNLDQEHDASALDCRPATPAQIPAALRLILSNSAFDATDSQIADFIRFSEQRGIHLADLQVISAGGRLLWAVLPMVNPGRTALLFAAPVRTAKSHPTAVDLAIESICQRLAAQNVQLAQALLDPSDQATIDAYAHRGFSRMAELIYLHRALRPTLTPPTAPPPPAAEFQLQTYSSANHAAFAAAIVASYQNSLDCPALNGVRDIEDVIIGHKAAGEFNPQDWFLLSRRDQPAAVLLLNRTPQIDTLELVYLGLAPAVRGLGIGNYLMNLALHRVRQRNFAGLTLAVDSRNTPALSLYHRHGMQRLMSKVALMRNLLTNQPMT
jgi:ribosomal protein S18 acetylase RimI-like enzyme